MKKTLLCLAMILAAPSAFAGFFSCTSDSGIIVSGNVDAEANVWDLNLMRLGDSGATPMNVESITINSDFQIYAVSTVPDKNGVVDYTITSVTGQAEGQVPVKFFIGAGDSGEEENGVCIIALDKSEEEE